MLKSEEVKPTKPQYLTIQKAVKLMDDFHLNEFKAHLTETRSLTALKLVETINSSVIDYTTADELCTAVYGNCDPQTRRSFNQLTSHTFRLTAYLSNNYPSYLLFNISRIERLVNSGNLDDATLLAEILLDVSEKIGDFHSQILVMKFMSQEANMYKSQADTVRWLTRIGEAIELERTVNDLYLYLRKNFNISVKDDSVLQALDKHFLYFRSFHQHDCPTIRIISKYSTFYLLYYYRPTEFVTERTQKDLIEFDEELNKYPLIILPFLEDIYSKFIFYKLNLSTTDLSSKEGKAEYNKLLTHNRHLKFWQNYVNIPELYALAIKSTYFLTRYHSINHRTNFRKIIPNEDKLEISRLTQRCEELVYKRIWKPWHVNDLIHFRLTWSALLLLGSSEQIKQGVSNLENLMTEYQQITFSESMDSIFICLMIGYFAKDDYEMCIESYKRYIKLAKGRVVNTENDLEIHTYYYVSQYLTNHRNQYLNKLQENYKRAGQHNSRHVIQQTLLELVSYFNIPVSL
jgi:hypothetical protein